MGFSLFEESKRTHKHVECKEDFYRELYELFEIARKQYLQEVVTNRMNPECFIELFECSRHYIDCDLSLCKNAHLMILNIIKELLSDKKIQVIIASNGELSLQDVIDFYVNYVTLDALSTQNKENFLTFGAILSEGQMDLLIDIVQAHNIFLFPAGPSRKASEHRRVQAHNIFLFPAGCSVRSVLNDFFTCAPHTQVYVKNVRNAATLLDAMAQCRLINNNWQHIVEKGNFLKKAQKGKSGKYITATCLSSSLARTRQRNTMTASQYAIRNAVAQMLKE